MRIKQILEPLQFQDRYMLKQKIIQLKQSDGEGWAIGEVIDRILELIK